MISDHDGLSRNIKAGWLRGHFVVFKYAIVHVSVLGCRVLF